MFKNVFIENKIRDLVLIFLLLLWFINPSNKLILLAFIIFLCILVYLTKKFDISLVLAFFLSSFFYIGKTYFFELNHITLQNFHNLSTGLYTPIQLSISDILFTLIIIQTIFMWNRKKIILKKISTIDFVLIIFIICGIFADIFFSSNPLLSILKKKELFEYIYMYFFIRYAIKDHKYLFNSLLSVLISLLIFEAFVCFQQFINSSPLGKNLEPNFGNQEFGDAPDQVSNIFRPPGTFDHPITFAWFLASIFPFLIYYSITSKRLIYKFTTLLSIICLILTMGRASWLAGLISLLIILFYFEYHKNTSLIKLISYKYIAFGVVFAIPLMIYSFPRILGIANIFQPGGGLSLRIMQINETLEIIKQSPLFGVGTGMSVIKAIEKVPNGIFASFPSRVHNYFMLLTVENGIISLNLMLIFLILSFKKLLNYKKDLAFISAVSLFSLIIISLFQSSSMGQFVFLFTALNYDKI